METRDLYRQKYEAQIHEWSAKMDVMHARAEMLSVQAKLDAKPRLDAVRAKMEAAKIRAQEIQTATDLQWEEVKASIERAWADTVGAAQGAYDAVMGVGDDATPATKTPSVGAPPTGA